MSLNGFVRPNVYDLLLDVVFSLFCSCLPTTTYKIQRKMKGRRSNSRKGPGHEVLLAYTTCAAQKQFQANFEVSEVSITYVTNRGKSRVILHIGAAHINYCQIMLKFFGYAIICSTNTISSKFRGVNHLCYKQVEG